MVLNAVVTPGDAVASDEDEKINRLHDLILKILDEDQAVDVLTIPLAGKTAIADHMVIASGRSTRQVASLAQKIAERVKRELGREVRIEGLPAADWVLLDAQDVIVHLFRPEVRTFYNLEKMWAFDQAPPPGRPVASVPSASGPSPAAQGRSPVGRSPEGRPPEGRWPLGPAGH